MNEIQRQAYLRAMGIDAVYPRLPIPAARPSPVYDWPTTAPPARTDTSETLTSRPAPRSGAAARAQVVSELVSPAEPDTASRTASRRAPEQTSAQAEVATAQQPDGEATLRFRLQYLPVNAALSVLWEVPLHGAADSERESRVLLVNILLALAAPLPETPPAVETFAWPILEDAAELPQGARQAGQAVAGFITMRRRRDGFANLLVFASQVADLLPGIGSTDQRADKLDCHLVCVNSLQTMLSVPAIKRDVWQQLQPLRQRLANHSH